jgi:hypothetical protein
MKKPDIHQVIGKVLGDEPRTTLGAGKPRRGMGSKTALKAGVMVDVPASPDVLKLNDELLAIQAAKANKGPSEKPSKKTVNAEAFARMLLKPKRPAVIQIEQSDLEARFETHTRGSNWVELSEPDWRSKAVQRDDVVKYGIAAALNGRQSAIVVFRDHVLGRISLSNISAQASQISQASRDSQTFANEQRERAGIATPLKKPFAEIFKSKATITEHAKSQNAPLTDIFETVGRHTINIGTVKPVEAGADVSGIESVTLSGLKRRIDLARLDNSIERNATRDPNYVGPNYLNTIFGEAKELLIYDGVTREPYAILARPENTNTLSL